MINTHFRRAAINSLWLLLLCSVDVFAQSSERTLSGLIALDTAINQPLSIEVTVRNHGFVVIPPAFTILRPIISSVSDVKVLEPNQTSAAFTISGISSNAVDYSIRFRCIDCSEKLRDQYYTLTGTQLGLSGPAYIDPSDLPVNLSRTLDTLGTVSGQVLIGAAAERSLPITIRLLDADSDSVIQTQSVILRKGQVAIDYSMDGLNRSRSEGYSVEMECFRCEQSLVRTAAILAASEDHEGVDFKVLASANFLLSGVLILLLSE
jgi:hypothetical protein